MINRKNLWFLTLFSLILVLGVYYITLPSEIFNAENTKTVNKQVDVNVSESDKLVALRVERNEKIEGTMRDLQTKITSPNITTDERNANEDYFFLMNYNIEQLKKETYK